MRRMPSWVGRSLRVALAAVALLAVLSALSNRGLPAAPEPTATLAPLDRARLTETFHLKSVLGDAVWPEWGEETIPVLLWNRHVSFLVAYPGEPAGWDAVRGESFQGETYFRQATGEHQNFAVEVDGTWVASMGSKAESDAFLIDMFHDMLPPVVEDVVPYRLLIQPSEVQITGVLHETFHVVQAHTSPERLESAERAQRYGDDYWTVDSQMESAWRTEIDLLVAAMEEESDASAARLVEEFLEQRRERRESVRLGPNLIDYERQLEWEEGVAKYVELEVWRQAWSADDYAPVAEMSADPDFKSYDTYPERWSQEVAQLRRQGSRPGDVRFYYTGMAQAILLDRFDPTWKDHVLEAGVWLEDLLAARIPSIISGLSWTSPESRRCRRGLSLSMGRPRFEHRVAS